MKTNITIAAVLLCMLCACKQSPKVEDSVDAIAQDVAKYSAVYGSGNWDDWAPEAKAEIKKRIDAIQQD